MVKAQGTFRVQFKQTLLRLSCLLEVFAGHVIIGIMLHNRLFANGRSSTSNFSLKNNGISEEFALRPVGCFHFILSPLSLFVLAY